MSVHFRLRATWKMSLAAVLVAACQGEPPSDREPSDGIEPPRGPAAERGLAHAPDSVLVRFRPGVDASATARTVLGQVASKTRARSTPLGRGSVQPFTALSPDRTLAKIVLEPSLTVEQAVAALRADPNVLYAEPNYLVRAQATPNDPEFATQWGLHNTGQHGGLADADIDAPEAWDLSTGSRTIVVGVLDTGVDYRHRDLAANIWVNPGEIAGNGLDDDGNGIVDDVHGFNSWLDNGDPDDPDGHGTYCAGIIGAVGNDGRGVVGVNWNVKLMPLAFLNSLGTGTVADAIEAIGYAVEQKRRGVNLSVLSSSWGGDAYSQALYDAIAAAGAEDILFVAAAGNGWRNTDEHPFYPASFTLPNLISVAATDNRDQLLYFSNYGVRSVHLAAPGDAIKTTAPNDGYSMLSGTSMAAAFVAGSAALVMSARPQDDLGAIRDALISNVDPVAALDDKLVSGGRLNLRRALSGVVPGFHMRAFPDKRAVNPGSSTTFDLELDSFGRFQDHVNVAVTSDPPFSGTLVVTPDPVPVDGATTAQLTATPDASASPGIYQVTITASAGAQTVTRQVSLRVRLPGTEERSYTATDTPIDVPDGPIEGTESVIEVPEPGIVQEVSVDLDVTAQFGEDVHVTLTSPDGTEVTVVERWTTSPGGFHQTFVFATDFHLEQGAGKWRLHIDDDLAYGAVTLDAWTLRFEAAPSGPTYRLEASDELHRINQGQAASVPLQVSRYGGFTPAVSFSTRAEPALEAAISVTPTAAGGTLQVAADCDTAPGAYTVYVTSSGGGIERTTPVSLLIYPAGTQRLALASTDTPAPVPDEDLDGLLSSVVLNTQGTVAGLEVEVHLSHEYVGDLSVSLISPQGQEILLLPWSEDTDLHLDRTFVVPEFIGASAAGTWTLRVVDDIERRLGTLDGWTLRPAVTPPSAPVADFSHEVSGLQVAFQNQSSHTGCGGALTHRWTFGDGTSSTEASPSHTYAAGGTYVVTLTVTDGAGRTAQKSVTVTVAGRTLTLAIERVLRNRLRQEFLVDLTWSGAQGQQVELWRNGLLVDLPDNDGVHRDAFRRYETSFVWKVCELHSSLCSNEVSVNFGSSLDSATISARGQDGVFIQRVVPIVDVE